VADFDPVHYSDMDFDDYGLGGHPSDDFIVVDDEDSEEDERLVHDFEHRWNDDDYMKWR